MEDRLHLAFLSSHLNLTQVKIELIYKVYASALEAIEDSFEKLQKIYPKQKWIEKLTKKKLKTEEIDIFKEELVKHKIQVVTFLDPEFPQSIKETTNCGLLFFQGNLKNLSIKSAITVVGSRLIQKESQQIMERILTPLSKMGLVIISGLASGVDSLAHQIALLGCSPTVAFLGSGLNEKVFYPKENWAMARQILDTGGLLISEYPPDFSATKFTFPARNRLIAASSELTWVVQASKSSGSLLTAKEALNMGKTVATTPASILNKFFDGNLELLKNGASIISDWEDILQILNLNNFRKFKETPIKTLYFATDWEERIFNFLGLVPTSLDNISQNLGIDIPTLNSYLSMLELSGLVENTGDNLWIRCA